MDTEKVNFFASDDFQKIYDAFRDENGNFMKLDGIKLEAKTDIPFKPLADYLARLKEYGIVKLERRNPEEVPDHYWVMDEEALKKNIMESVKEMRSGIYSRFGL